MHGLAVYVKEGLPFAWDLSLSVDSYLCFQLALLHSVSCFFCLNLSPSSSLCMVFDSISSNTDELLSINTSVNMFVFGDFNVHRKDWLTYSGGTDRPGEHCYNFFLSQMTLLRWLTFLLRSQIVTLTVLLFWISFFLLRLCSRMAFPPLENSDHVVSASIDFPLNSQQAALFHCIACNYSCADWNDLCDHLRNISWEDIFKLSASAAATSEFCDWVQVGIDVHILHHKYQVKRDSSLWFSAAFAAAIVNRNHFFLFLPTE